MAHVSASRESVSYSAGHDNWPIRGQYPGHVTSIDQSEASIVTVWPITGQGQSVLVVTWDMSGTNVPSPHVYNNVTSLGTLTIVDMLFSTMCCESDLTDSLIWVQQILQDTRHVISYLLYTLHEPSHVLRLCWIIWSINKFVLTWLSSTEPKSPHYSRIL